MATFQDIAALSILPIINLREINEVKDGLLIKKCSTCNKNLSNHRTCKDHYSSLGKLDLQEPKFVQCPVGFASLAFSLGHLKCALTGFIPYPRLGGEQEQIQGKKYSDLKMSQTYLLSIVSVLQNTFDKIDTLQKETIKNESMALHEIRKMNRTIKQTAERYYNKNHSTELLQILKTSELMSKQFDIIEILANESLAQLPTNNLSEIYKIFDKCVHIYQTSEERIKLSSPPGYSPKAMVSDKTFPIIVTVLIENALKYSPAGSVIGITLEKDEDACLLKVSNMMSGNIKLDSTVFNRGVRSGTDTEGSGNGLYVAQLIAKQHNTIILLQCSSNSDNKLKCTFSFRINTV